MDTWSRARLLVRSIKNLVQAPSAVNQSTSFQWNNWLPLKTNIFGWRTILERNATRKALATRNIHVDSLLCPLCDLCVEDMDHLLNSYIVTNPIWNNLATWFKIPPIYAFSSYDLFRIHKGCNFSKRTKKIIHAIMVSSAWCIWKARNDLIFNNLAFNIQRLLQEIKSITFLWIKIRSTYSSLTWKDWCNFAF